MLNHKGSHHEHFEELCALAAIGQISEVEFVDLQDHLRVCAPCQSTYTDFIDLIHDKLPLAYPKILSSSKLPGFFSEDSSHSQRFLARARKEGLAISQPALRETAKDGLKPWFWSRLINAPLVTLAVALLLAAVGLLGYGLYQSNVRYRKLALAQAELTDQLRRQN